MKKVLITGGNGFVGRWLVEHLLESGTEVYSIVRDKKSVFSSDKYHEIICDMKNIKELPTLLTDREFDAFYHLAWEGSTGGRRSDYELQLSNVKYSCDAMEVAKEMGCMRFLAAGTITEQIVDETVKQGKTSPNLIYGIAKKTSNYILNTLARQFKIEFVWMQFSNIFGPGNYSGNLIGYTFDEILNGRIPEYSTALQPYDFIYIKDLVHAILLLGDAELTCTSYFIGSGNPRILRDYLLAIPQIIESDICMGIGKRADDGVTYQKEWFDTSLLQRDTGFETEYEFEQAIKETYNLWK